MVPASLYETIYLLVVTIISIAVFMQYQKRNGNMMYLHKGSDVFAMVVMVSLVLFIGLRPLSGRSFVDMVNYASYYDSMLDGAIFYFDPTTDNLIFDNLFAWWGSVRLGYTSFFLLIAAIYFGASYLGIKKLFPNDTLAAYIVFLAAFSTFSYATNGIKAGAAASLFILALGYRENLKVCIPLVFLSWGFHHSMIMVVAAFGMTLFIKNPKVYFGMWIFCFLMAATHITTFAQFFSGFTTEHGAEYLLGEGGSDGTRGGFRIDFIIYSAVSVVIGWYAVFKKKVQLSSMYKNLLNLYICLNAIWMLCMYAEFTNRIAYLSWFIYPIVLIYPFLQEQWGSNRYKTFSLVMLGHLGFTLFMNIIYYA
jgi:hypothetical protein